MLSRKTILAMIVVMLLSMLLASLVADNFRIDQLTRILVYVILVVSLDLLVGYTGLVSVGHAAFFGCSVYIAALLADRLSITNPLFVLPVSIFGAGLLAFLIGLLTQRLQGVYYIMATLAFTQIVFYLLHDTKFVGGSDGILVSDDIVFYLMGHSVVNLSNLHHRFYFTLFMTAVVMIGLFFVVGSPFGHVLQGIRQNERRMKALGYKVALYKLAAFTLAGMLSGVAGYLYFCLTGFADPTLTNWLHSAQLLIITALGGAGTLVGPALSAVIFTLFVDWSSEITEHWKLYLGVIVVVLTLFGRLFVRTIANRFVSEVGKDV